MKSEDRALGDHRPTEGRPTLGDIAKRSGVSLRTTKKVMSGREAVSSATKIRVLAAAEELGYRKNHIASALALSRRERIAIVYSAVTSAYFPEVKRGFNEFAAEYQDYGLEVELHEGSNTNATHQAAVLQRVLEDEAITGVVLQPVSATELNPLIGMLAKAEKPVITFGADAPASTRLAYIGPNAYRAGRVGAQILANYIGKEGNVLLISRGAGHMQTQDRRQGFLDMIAEYYPKLDHTELLIEDAAGTYAELKSALENNPVKGIFSTYADSTIAGQVLADVGRKNIVLVGFDMSEETAGLMRSGHIKVILEQNPGQIAYVALKMMFEYKYHNVLPQSVLHTDISIVTSECLP